MTGIVSRNTMLYIPRCAKYCFNPIHLVAGPQTNAPYFRNKIIFTVLLKVIKHFPSSTWCWTNSCLCSNNADNHQNKRICLSEGPLLVVPPAARAEVTLCQCHKAWKLVCWNGENHFLLELQMVLCHILAQLSWMLSYEAKFSPNIECESYCFCFFFHFPFPLNSKNMGAGQNVNFGTYSPPFQKPCTKTMIAFLCHPHILWHSFISKVLELPASYLQKYL